MQNYTFIAIILGLCIGSFINVIIYRLPRNVSIVVGRSHCPSCKNQLTIIDLIPLISWIFLKGKCRYCLKDISLRYPLVELSTSIIFFLCLYKFSITDSNLQGHIELLAGWVLSGYLISLFMIDIDHMILPQKLTSSGSIVGILFTLSNGVINNNWASPLINCLTAYLIGLIGIYVLNLLVKVTLKKPGIGIGDAKLFAMSGTWLGLAGLEVTLTLSFLLAGTFSLIGLIIKRIRRGEYIPFGPFICISMFLVWIFGIQFWYDYLYNIFWWRSL